MLSMVSSNSTILLVMDMWQYQSVSTPYIYSAPTAVPKLGCDIVTCRLTNDQE